MVEKATSDAHRQQDSSEFEHDSRNVKQELSDAQVDPTRQQGPITFPQQPPPQAAVQQNPTTSAVSQPIAPPQEANMRAAAGAALIRLISEHAEMQKEIVRLSQILLPKEGEAVESLPIPAAATVPSVSSTTPATLAPKATITSDPVIVGNHGDYSGQPNHPAGTRKPSKAAVNAGKESGVPFDLRKVKEEDDEV